MDNHHLDKLQEMYNGYRFHPLQLDADRIMNPLSVLKSLRHHQFKPEWANSSTPEALLSVFGLHSLELLQHTHITEAELFGKVAEVGDSQYWQQLAFNAGYWTILDVDPCIILFRFALSFLMCRLVLTTNSFLFITISFSLYVMMWFSPIHIFSF